MTGILAIETATDVCSVAVYAQGQIRECDRIAPRQHSQLLFPMLEELVPGGRLTDQGIGAIAYGCGPGSFTGLRIAASAAQGLAYSTGLPAIAVSTLAALAQSALRQGEVGTGDTVLCTLDARINEVYSAVYGFVGDLAVMQEGPWACAPADLAPVHSGQLYAVGNGCPFLDQLPRAVHSRIRFGSPAILPSARDVIVLAREKLRLGETQLPTQVQPVYVRDEISWKKLDQQGRQS